MTGLIDYEKLTKSIGQAIVNVITLLVMCYLAGLIVAWLYSITFQDYDATDDAQNGIRSKMALYTDYGTGCQYLATRSGHLTPRLDKDGKHMCGE